MQPAMAMHDVNTRVGQNSRVPKSERRIPLRVGFAETYKFAALTWHSIFYSLE